jgi:hypothetical protein
MRTCSDPICPRAWASATWANTGASGSPLIAVRGPKGWRV